MRNSSIGAALDCAHSGAGVGTPSCVLMSLCVCVLVLVFMMCVPAEQADAERKRKAASDGKETRSNSQKVCLWFIHLLVQQ